METDGAADDAQRFGESLIERLGPETTPTLVNIKALSLEHFGWQGDGEEMAIAHAPAIMKATPSTDDYPSVVYRDSTGGWIIKGADLSPSSADWGFDDARIRRAAPIPIKSRFKSVQVRYAKSWTARTENVGVRPTDSGADRFAGEAAKEWRSVTSGAGSPVLIIDTYFLRRSDAQAYADRMLEIAEDAQLWEVVLHPPRPQEETQIEPFDSVEITYQAGGNGYLSSPRKGTIVGYTYRGSWPGRRPCRRLSKRLRTRLPTLS
jgi:hypothetical protein